MVQKYTNLFIAALFIVTFSASSYAMQQGTPQNNKKIAASTVAGATLVGTAHAGMCGGPLGPIIAWTTGPVGWIAAGVGIGGYAGYKYATYTKPSTEKKN